MAEELKPFTKAKRFVWCQEEPKNMGAWMFVRDDLEEVCGERIGYSGREASASPAEGAKVAHKRAQAKLVAEAFTV